MQSVEEQVRIAVDYVRNIGNGGIDEKYLADDMCAWSISSHWMPRASYWPRLKHVKAIFTIPLEMTIDTTTAQPGRVVVQARSRGVLYTGDEYTNEYLFLIEFNEQGKIRHAREFFDPVRLRTILMPALLKYEEELANQEGEADQTI
jgi:ketosteroid isomerase-like protein